MTMDKRQKLFREIRGIDQADFQIVLVESYLKLFAGGLS